MIIQALTNAFKLDLLQRLMSDVFRMALYADRAILDVNTLSYTPDGEVNGPGYAAGGLVLSGMSVVLEGTVALIDWADPVWPNATITARGALIYNFTQANRAVAVIDLGKNYASTNGSFMVMLPEPTAKNALIRIG
jgi:hypothetical protein